MSTTQRDSAPRDSNAEDTIRDFIAHRPRRTRDGRVVAGVAAGIGRRYGIDPVLVRVALVVSAVFGGAGVLLYLLAWLLFAEETDEVSPFEALLHRGRSNTSRGLTLVLVIALFPASSFVFGGHWSTVAGGLMLLAALYLLHRSRADYRPAAPAAPAGPTDRVPPGYSTTATDSEVGAMPEQPSPTEGPRTTPPAWDPLGAAPFAWDLPDPNPVPPPPPPPPPRPKARVGLATLGATLVVTALLAVASTYTSWLSPRHILGIAIGVVGIGLVAGAHLRSGRGLIPLALVLSIVGLGLTATNFTGWRGSGEVMYRPTSVSEVLPNYSRSVGQIRLDLTGLPNTHDLVRTSIHINAGDVTVIVPSTADVVATCDANVGDVMCLDQRESGPDLSPVHATQNDNGTSTGLKIVLDEVQADTGSVRVITGG